MTHIENIKALGNRIVDNLNTMGVSASFSDGALTLADKILEIQTGLNLNTNLTLTSSSQSINFGESIVLTSKITANYDGPIDLHNGLLENATIKFYNGDTLIGTSTTDINGEASLTYTPSNYGDITLKAVFEGDEGFNPTRSSNVMVTVIAFDDIMLTSDKDILSYNSGTNPDVATLTAQLTNSGEPVAVAGETVTFEVRKQSDDSLVETLSDVTDSSGKATVSYYGKGAGDIYIKAECRLLIQTYEVEDCYKANLSASYSFGTSDTKYKIYEIPVWDSYEIEGKLKSSQNNRFSLTLKAEDTNNGLSNVRSGAYITLESAIFDNAGEVIVLNRNIGNYTANTFIKVKFVYNNGNMKLYINDTLTAEHSIEYYPKYLMLHSYTNSKTVSVEDIKIKPL